jgi:hypothetical protein
VLRLLADERGTSFLDALEIEERQNLNAAIASADSNDGVRVHFIECAQKRQHPDTRTSRGECLAVKDGVIPDRLETDPLEFGHTRVELGAVERAGRRDQRHAAALSNGTELQEARRGPGTH